MPFQTAFTELDKTDYLERLRTLATEKSFYPNNMATDMCVRRLTKELNALKKEPITNPKILVAPNESNILEMHYVIEGSPGTPYEGGVYHGKLIFPKDYPLKPPVSRTRILFLAHCDSFRQGVIPPQSLRLVC